MRLILLLAALAMPTAASAFDVSATCNESKLNGSITTCDAAASVTIQSPGPEANVSFVLTAPSTHCSKTRYTVLSGDGTVTFGQTKFLDPGKTAVVHAGDGFAAGSQGFKIKADGKVGGCNTGTMGSWGVDFEVEVD